ncbi:MAG: CDP-alcohol phosphatidyltransferase family protein [Spirochaetaceae bacterium]|nr:CDP-alcohol phosphatidyltransferase family protein [Spirochaetaceae bacterium]
MNVKCLSCKNVPNILSLLRLLLVFPFVIIIHDIFVHGCTKNLFLLITFFTIIISDAADGFLARKLKCASDTGAKLDIVSDALYTVLSLAAFAYFKVIPGWFVFVLVLKLLEFVVTSRIMRNRQKTGNKIFFDKMGKISVSVAMLLPGVFVFRCVITDYKTVMNTVVYMITAMFVISFFNRIAQCLFVPGKKTLP